MCSNITVLDITAHVEEAMEAITMTKRHHILVREDKKIIAIISIGDILYNILEDRARIIEQLENYIHTY